MGTYASPVAFSVQGSEHGHIVFAKSHVEARRVGAAEVGEDFETVESVNRVPALDCYAATGKVPPRVLIEDHGWWYECIQCLHQIQADDLYDYDEDRTLQPEYEGNRVFCCGNCRNAFHDERHREAQLQLQRASAALARFPGIEILHANGHDRDAAVQFKFPGGQYGATWRVGEPDVWVAKSDQDAFHAFQDRLIAERAAMQADAGKGE